MSVAIYNVQVHVLQFTIKPLVKLGHSQKIALGSIQFIAKATKYEKCLVGRIRRWGE